MGIYSNVDTGTRIFRSRFHKSISFSKKYDCRFGELVPVLSKFVLPGDVWRIGGQALVRYHPMVTPSLTPNYMKVRYFFVPLRLIEENSELIITGSKDGHLYNGTLPVFDNFVTNADKVYNANAFKVAKYDFWDYMGVPVGDYEVIKNNECLPAAYWKKAYIRIKWDYYMDENLSSDRSVYSDFEDLWNTAKKNGCNGGLSFSLIPKDYFSSALPWQLKAPGGIGPVLDVTGTASFTPTFTGKWAELVTQDDFNLKGYAGTVQPPSAQPFILEGASVNDENQFSANINNRLNQPQTATITGLGFNADELRTMMAQTRIFERLARTGSRYTEYLRANFGISPADGTLQRAQYLGGWKLPIVTTEVLQTAEDGSNPVGTMRGHGITNGGNRISTFVAKEFGLLFGIAHILPQIEYTNGISKELSYKKRFDFFNPSLQHLSEQEVRNGELYVSFTDSKNDDTFGFQAYGNELRSSVNQVVADLRASLKSWNQSIDFGNSRPNLNQAFLQSDSYLSNFNQCFAVNGSSARPCIVEFYNDLDVYRPMVKYSTPGLVDHL